MTGPEFSARLERLAAGAYPAVRATVMRAGLAAERDAKRNATTAPRVRTGRLRSSIASSVEAAGESLYLVLRAGGVGTDKDVKYARLQELGGTVRPIKGKYLAIPVGPAKTAAGVSRYASPRDVPGLVFVQSLKGQPLLVQLTGKGGKAKVTVWYVLRRSVTVRARPYLKPAIDAAAAALPGQISEALGRLAGGA